MSRKSAYAKQYSGPASCQEFTAIGLALAITMAIFAYTPTDAISMDLARFEWKNRLLLIFAPDVMHPHYEQIDAEINAQSAEVRDRDLVVFEIFDKDPSQMDASPLSPADADALRKHFGISRQMYALILVGKDGGVKLKREDRVPLSEIFELIDSMPMRTEEMRQKNE